MADDPTPPADPETPPAGNESDDALGDGGKKALESERAARREAERAARAASDQLATLQSQLDELKAGQMSDQEKALEAARKEAADAARAEVESTYRQRLDAADVLAAATGFANPAAAEKFLDLSTLPRDDAGALDKDALKAALAQVLEDEPYLAGTKPSPGSADGGARGGAGAQLTRADLQNMTPDQITAAKAEGRLASLLGH